MRVRKNFVLVLCGLLLLLLTVSTVFKNNAEQTEEALVWSFTENMETWIKDGKPSWDHTRPWYMMNGSTRPREASINSITGRREARLWPEEDSGDRILHQLMYIPPSKPERPIKTIFIEKIDHWRMPLGQRWFVESNCPVDSCSIVQRNKNADAVLFRDTVTRFRLPKDSKQIWILYVLENPLNAGKVKQNDAINWTSTYRSDSDIVAPYERWVYFNEGVRQKLQKKNYAEGKKKKVAWFVSNCKARNNRLEYAKELMKYIEVDIYGQCGNKLCPKNSLNNNCMDMLRRDYKFYLSFENANCRDYITEKLYLNGLQNDILPIVMGAHPDDYKRFAPMHSYIHVDDFPSAKDLAAYLHQLDEEEELYNSYFRWKGTGEFINTYFFCRLCAMLNDDVSPRHNPDFPAWWHRPDTCRPDGWST